MAEMAFLALSLGAGAAFLVVALSHRWVGQPASALGRATFLAMAALSVTSAISFGLSDDLSDRAAYVLFGTASAVTLIAAGLFVVAIMPTVAKRYGATLDQSSRDAALLVGRATGIMLALMGTAMIPVTIWLATFPP